MTSASAAGALHSSADTGMPVQTVKADLRKRIKADLKQAPLDSLQQQSSDIWIHLQSLPSFVSAQRIVAYLACEWLREVNIGAAVDFALEQDKDVFVPRVKDKNSNMQMLRIATLHGLQKMPPFDIVEPTETGEAGKPRVDLIKGGIVPDIVLLPGLGFDRQGGRLGRGGGYYDKFLKDVREMAQRQAVAQPLLAAVAFREQVVDHVPMDGHDVRYDLLITADGVMDRQ